MVAPVIFAVGFVYVCVKYGLIGYGSTPVSKRARWIALSLGVALATITTVEASLYTVSLLAGIAIQLLSPGHVPLLSASYIMLLLGVYLIKDEEYVLAPLAFAAGSIAAAPVLVPQLTWLAR